MVKEAGAQGLEVVHEEITGQKLAFSIFSVEKFDEPKDALGHSESCTVGCLVFQRENKIAALSILSRRIGRRSLIADSRII